jgi:apolipoprotein N-acyltransferase
VTKRIPLPVLGAVGGVLLAVGLPPLAFPPLALLGVLGFVHLLDRARETRGAALAGGAFAGAASLVALHWVPAAADPWLGPGGALAAGLSTWMLHACVGALVVAASTELRETLPLALRAGAAWGVLEWLPGAIPVIGLPWFGVAASLTGWPVLLPLVAVAGSGGIGVLLAALLGAGVHARRAPRVALATLVGATAVAGATLLLPAAPALDPIPSPHRMAALEWVRPRAEVADLERLRSRVEAMLRLPLPSDDPAREPMAVLWPEAPLPGVPGGADPGMTVPGSGAEGEDLLTRYLRRVQSSGDPGPDPDPEDRAPAEAPPPGTRADAATTGRVAPSAGAVTGIQAAVQGRRYNALVRTGSLEEPPEGVHRKRYLVPGVERTTLTAPGREGRGLAPGAGALPFAWGGVQAGGLICFEILYPAEVARLRRRGATLLVQATNDAMLQPGGRFPVVADAARRQHEAMLRLRAAEFGMPAVRAAHGGRALAAGPDGRWLEPVAVMPLGEGDGRWMEFELPPAAGPPPSVWVGPPLGPLALALLLLPLVALWRRAQVLSRGRR